jgi:hypothetical protein
MAFHYGSLPSMPENHRFPAEIYPSVTTWYNKDLSPTDLQIPQAANYEQRVHTLNISIKCCMALDEKEVRRLGLPVA